MQIVFLGDRRDAIPTVAGWYFDQWGCQTNDLTITGIEAKMRGCLNRDLVPLILLAVEQEEVVGVAELKYREMDIYPEKEHWLGGVFVPPQHRGRRIASCLANSVAEIAGSLGVKTLHLQTERLDGGLYVRLGWKPSEQVLYKGLEVLVMERPVASKNRLERK